VIFVIPFFYIVGFDKGDVAAKFFWYWLFQALYVSTFVYLGQFFANVAPNIEVASGMMCADRITTLSAHSLIPYLLQQSTK